MRRLLLYPPTRLFLAGAAAAFAMLLISSRTVPALGVLVGVALGPAVFLIASLLALWPLDPEETRANARREDFSPVVEELLIVAAAVAAIIGIAILLVLDTGAARDTGAAVGLGGVFMSWSMVHLMYAARYADLYYRHPPGGIDFNTETPPAYKDFLYFSYNLGMTFQVSDTDVSTTQLRAVILRHCLLSYVFSTVILAATINLVAQIALT